jgi:hypothetical protein
MNAICDRPHYVNVLSTLVLFVVFLAIVAVTSASAAEPVYTLENCFGASASTDCAAGTQLGSAVAATPSPDGSFVYGVAGAGGLTLYTRSAAQGTLTRVPGAAGCYNASGAGGCTTEEAIIAPFDLVFDPTDPTGAYAYVVGNTGTLDILARSPSTGAFTAQANCISDTLGSCTQPSATTEVLTGSRAAVFSADGKNLYVASSGRNSGADDGVTRYSVGPSHIPVFQGCTTESGAGTCNQVAGLSGGTDQLAIPPTGNFLYSTGVTDNSIAVFSRNTTSGVLTATTCYSPTDSTDCIATSSDVLHPYALLIPPDDQTKLYVGTASGVSVFQRNTTTGALAHLQCLNATGAGGCVQAPGLGIAVTNQLALSSDGTDLALTEAGPNGGVVFLKRDKATGLLSELPSGAGCITADGTGGTCRTLTALGGISIVHAAPNASQFYLGATANGTIAGFRAALASEPAPAPGPLGVTASKARPDTRLTRFKIDRRKSKATFAFKAVGPALSFQCELKRGHKKARFHKCTSPKTYKDLKAGKYVFEVRAVGSGGPDPTPVKKRFKLRS